MSMRYIVTCMKLVFVFTCVAVFGNVAIVNAEPLASPASTVDSGKSESSDENNSTDAADDAIVKTNLQSSPETAVNGIHTTPGTEANTKIAATSSIALLESNLIKIQRGLFKDAVEALEKGDLEGFNSLKEQSKDYILYPYLVYYDYRNSLSSESEKDLMDFIETYKDTPLSYKLSTQWLYRLAEDKNWEMFLKVYRGQGGSKIRCAYISAKLETDKSPDVLKKYIKEIKKHYLVGNQQPAECNPLFNILKDKKLLTSELIWERIELSMEKGNYQWARELAKSLSGSDRERVKLWIEVHRNPERVLKRTRFSNSLMARKIIKHGIKRLARSDATKARKLWAKLSRKRGFSGDDYNEIKRYTALRAAYQHNPDALAWLNGISKKYADADVRYWRGMTALRKQDWKALRKAIRMMEKEEREDSKWRYWQARSEEQLGNKALARKLFTNLATETNYYGFMAADRVGKPYSFNLEALEKDEKAILEIMTRPEFKRTKELFFVGKHEEAYSEWALATRKFKKHQLQQAALISHEWGWHFNAIVTIAQSGHFADYNVRFPTPYKEVIFNNAKTHDLDPTFIYGVARRESAFKATARSSVGALGLMQLMPGTARLESKRLGRNRPSYEEILDEENNIYLGSSYLNRMMDRFGGNQALAAAAYNAGPQRVDRWIPENKAVSTDIWIDTLPFKETREYVRAVLAYSTIFTWKLDHKMKPISERIYPEISRDAIAAMSASR